MDLVVLGAGPSYSRRARRGRRFVPRGRRRPRAAPRLRPGCVPVARKRARAVRHSTAIADQPPAPGSLHRPRGAAPLPPLRVRRRRDESASSGPRASATASTRSTPSPASPPPTLDVEAVGGPSTRSVGPFTIEAGLVTHTDESYAYRVSAPVRRAVRSSTPGTAAGSTTSVPLVQPGDVVADGGLVRAGTGTAGRVPPGRPGRRPRWRRLDGRLTGDPDAPPDGQRPRRRPSPAFVRAGYDGPVEFVAARDCASRL